MELVTNSASAVAPDPDPDPGLYIRTTALVVDIEKALETAGSATMLSNRAVTILSNRYLMSVVLLISALAFLVWLFCTRLLFRRYCKSMGCFDHLESLSTVCFRRVELQLVG